MTCKHVLDLIDAGSLTHHAQTHLAAAWEHARHCSTCGPAMEAATTLTHELGTLAHLPPPPDLAAVVLARIERLEPATAAGASAGTEKQTQRASSWPAWLHVAGLAIGMALIVSLPAVHTLPADILALRLLGPGSGAATTLPELTWGVVPLAIGLVLFVVSLVAPVSEGQQL